VTPYILPDPLAVPDAIRSLIGPLVWVVRDADPLPTWAEHPNALTDAERQRADRTRHPRAQAQFLRGRTILRAALGSVLRIAPNTVPLVVTPDGKPVLDPQAGLPALHFNVSHTDGAAVFAVSPVPVGVDVERHRDGRDLLGLVSRFFATEEREQFIELPDELRVSGFLRGWTCKEALLKGIGSGVRDLQNCAVELDPRCSPTVLRCPAGEHGWQLMCWQVSDEIAAAVAVQRAVV